MIVKEDTVLKGRDFVRTYSDRKVWIERDGVEYEDAYDPKELAEERIYTETDKPIEEEPIEEE